MVENVRPLRALKSLEKLRIRFGVCPLCQSRLESISSGKTPLMVKHGLWTWPCVSSAAILGRCSLRRQIC